MESRLSVGEVARVAHEVNRAYCAALGDVSQLQWDEAPEWQKKSAITGVKFNIDNKTAPLLRFTIAGCVRKWPTAGSTDL